MRRKIVQDFANTLCQMLVGWRMGEDLEVLAALPDGTLSINVLEGAASHDKIGAIQLHVAGELQSWLSDRLNASRIPAQIISSAEITVKIRTDRVDTNRKRIVSFDFSVQSVISTDECSYVGKLHETHRWHSRISDREYR
eukprot:TRINITY_DN76978_c0_g1_i1.p1 TRINITY_DN76978_c0_g1~~TRINITY_DN76978_c0_g1_i1.p1  ORF type:complete len:140 (-),score=16.83 TRINITY_DN76978_c0_g1_i1:199-618(-)